MRAYRRLRKVGNKLEDQKILDGGASQLLRTEAAHRSQDKKEVLTLSHRDQVLFNFAK